MIIIKEGNKTNANAIVFKCDFCDCIWIAEKGEYITSENEKPGFLPNCFCPFCNSLNFCSNPIIIDYGKRKRKAYVGLG